MSACPGIKIHTKSRCGTTSLFRCKKCGHVGCAQVGCSNQAFDSYKCMRCGTPSSRISL
jgi:DNA-directed RNA polymerase subunit RPC12/RpoP